MEDKAEHETDACAVCGDGGNLLICDGCEGEYHTACQKPILKEIPEGDWECDDCVNRKFLGAREFLIRNSKLFDVYPDPSDTDMVAYRPAENVLDAVGKMAKSVSEALSLPLAGSVS